MIFSRSSIVEKTLAALLLSQFTSCQHQWMIVSKAITCPLDDRIKNDFSG